MPAYHRRAALRVTVTDNWSTDDNEDRLRQTAVCRPCGNSEIGQRRRRTPMTS
jgi:hypothetical protein